ncbi:UNVERIFIED_CONTAM: Retrovirus-related Pol polyprotein from transposon TNT 1-94 [Sesamum calycinum]|uniref:Retrovirus-related Pol polyprotein from transposon TNT 1-94 n=1 Tax=Sesamum calycinum TaxID=2727403 RepID=A0AAW2QLQ0_9LAMI
MMYDGTVRTLSDVRHIPDLKKNLILLGTLHKNDIIPKADEYRKTIRIVKGELTMMKGKRTAGNIYKLLGNTVVGGVHSVDLCDDNTKLWHMRLSHLSEHRMTELHKRNLLHGVKSCKLDFCGKVAEEVWTGNPVDFFYHLRIFSCSAYVHVPSDERSKLDSKSKQGIFLGYKKGVKDYKFWDPIARKMMELEPHPVAIKNRGSSHPTSADPIAIESSGSSHPTSGGSTTNELGDESTTFHGAITSQEKKEWMGAMCLVDDSSIFLLLYVDDMHDVIALKALLSQEFDMKDLVLNRFGISKAKPMSTPLANHFKLSLEQCPKTAREIENMAKVPYASAFGCLMYAMVYTRPNLAHVVFKSANRCLNQRNDPLVVRYVDSDCVGDLDDRRSKTGYVFTLGGGLICWKSTVQSILASSTAEAEYMAVTEAAKEALWLNGLAKELGVEQGGVQLYCDSQSAICLAKNQVYHVRIKHTDSRYHKIRELIASGGITLQKFATSLLVSVLFHFKLVNRSCNSVAHVLAKSACGFDEIFSIVPLWLLLM